VAFTVCILLVVHTVMHIGLGHYLWNYISIFAAAMQWTMDPLLSGNFRPLTLFFASYIDESLSREKDG